MSNLIRCDMCGKQIGADVAGAHGYLRLEAQDGEAVPGGKYPPLPRHFCSWQCTGRYMTDVVSIFTRAS